MTDEQVLQSFEWLVTNQQPAVALWTPVTPFDFDSRKIVEGEHPRLIKETFDPERVIDAGCGPGHLLRLLGDLGVQGIGLDIKPYSRPGIIRADVSDPLLTAGDSAGSQADLVICREVLEHLTIRQIRETVRNLCRMSSRYVYVTTRFAKDPASILDVDTSDDLDPTHITMLTQPLLRLLFVLEGFKRRADLEQKMDWKQLGRVLVYERA